MNQLDVFGGQHQIGTPELTHRQQTVLELVRTHPDGVTADEAGAHLHQLAGRHSADQRCEYDARNGRPVLEALVKKEHLRRRKSRVRGTGWLYVAADRDATGDDVVWAQGDLPEGF